MDKISVTRGLWTLERLWDCIDWYGKDGSACWNWLGLAKQGGYGRVRIKTAKGYKSYLVSRLIAYDSGLLANLEYKGHGSGTTVRHICDNPKCCNPTHLTIGTQKDNIRDMLNRGRHRAPKGASASLAKLTESDIPVIRNLHNEMLMTKKDIAKIYGVSDAAVGYIIRGKTWRHC
jgi:hypothetical protein